MIHLQGGGIELNLFYIAMRGHPIGTAVAVVPTFHGPEDMHVAAAEPADKPAELAAKALPIAIDPLDRRIVRLNAHPDGQLWQLSHSTVTCRDAE
jgi:hypothetical protein